MKKTLFLVLALFVKLVAWCQDPPPCQINVTFPAKEQIETKNPYADAIPMTDPALENGTEMITGYTSAVAATMRPPILGNNIKYFMVDAATLLNYLYTYESLFEQGTPNFNQIHHVEFVYGKNGANITLSIVGVDEDLNYIYLPSNQILSYCLSCSATGGDCSSPTNLVANATQYVPYPNTDGIQVSGKNFPPIRSTAYSNYSGFITKSTFQTWTGNYRASITRSIDQTTTFLFDPGTLANYIFCTDGIQDIQLILARRKKGGGSTLVIVGVDKDGKQIYLPSANPSVLEHCYPCPSECTDLVSTPAFQQYLKKTHLLNTHTKEYIKAQNIREINKATKNIK